MTWLSSGSIGRRAGQALGTPLRPIGRFLAGLVLAFLAVGQVVADDTSNFKTVSGISAYIGLMPAEIVKGHAPGHPEAQMHGGSPSGPHAYHLVVALFDEVTSNRIENATVTATVSGLGDIGQTNVLLEPMLIADTVTYGTFFNLQSLERFDITLTIELPDRPEPVRVIFDNEHLP